MTARDAVKRLSEVGRSLQDDLLHTEDGMEGWRDGGGGRGEREESKLF